MRVNTAVFLVFLTLEITEILLVIGFFNESHGGSAWWLHAGGWSGSSPQRGVVHVRGRRRQRDVAGAGDAGRRADVGPPAVMSRLGSPMPRRAEV